MPSIPTDGVGSYFLLAGAAIAYFVGFISVWLAIGMLIYSLVKRNWSVWKKWKYVGYLMLVAIVLAILGVLITTVTSALKKSEKSQSIQTVPPSQAPPPAPAPPPQASNKTVLDYYYELPKKYFMGGENNSFTRQEREQAIQVKDLENYYIEFSPNYIDGNGSLTVFVTPQKEHIIAVETKGCGPGCEQKFYFLTYKDGLWKDVTNEVFPNIASQIAASLTNLQWYLRNRNPNELPIGNLLIRLPQHGTTIEYYDQFSQIVLWKFLWRQGKFIPEEISLDDLQNQKPAWEREE